MNKYTLKFKDAEIETQYQQNNYSFRYPFIIGFHLATIIVGIIKIVDEYKAQNNLHLSLYSVLCLYSLLSYPLIHKMRKLQEIDLFFINHMIALLQLAINPQSTPYDHFNFGAILMMTHTIIFFICDFSFTSVQIFTIGSLRIVISTIQIQSSVSYYLTSVFMIFVMVLCAYKINQVRRGQFLLTLQKNEWTHILPKIVKSPYVMFHYDPYWRKFILDTSGNLPFDCQNQVQLTQFLRSSIVINQSLEQFIFRRITKQKQNNHLNEHMVLIRHKLKLKTELISYYLAANCFILIFEENKIQEQLFKRQQAARIKQLEINHISFIYKLFKKVNQGIETRDLQTIKKARYILFHIFLQKQLIHQQQYNQQCFNLLNSLNFLKKIFFQKQIIIINNDIDTNIVTQRSYLISKIVEIISKFKCRKMLITIKRDNENDVILTFTGYSFDIQKAIRINHQYIKCIEPIRQISDFGVRLTILRIPNQSFNKN